MSVCLAFLKVADNPFREICGRPAIPTPPRSLPLLSRLFSILKFNPYLTIYKTAKQILKKRGNQLSQYLGSINLKMLPSQIITSEKLIVAVSFWRHQRQVG
jgi:hypothetical protein